jgi:stress-induced morphogen
LTTYMTEKPVESAIRSNLETLAPLYCEVINESYMHNVPEGSESHFKVVLVSEQFGEKMQVARHRLVNELLKAQLDGPIHALSLHTMTPDEWSEKGSQSPQSPDCLGGNKL